MKHDDLIYVPLDDHEHYLYSEDFEESTALSAKGYSVESIDSTRSRSIFIFKKAPGIVRDSESHFAGTLMVSSLKLAAARRALKSRLYRTRAIY